MDNGDMSERCTYCIDQKFYCQEPSVPLIQGRWRIPLNGQTADQKIILDPEKMEKCAKRMEVIEFERKR